MEIVLFSVLRATLFTAVILAVVFIVRYLVRSIKRAVRNGKDAVSGFAVAFLKVVGMIVFVFGGFGVFLLIVVFAISKAATFGQPEKKQVNKTEFVQNAAFTVTGSESPVAKTQAPPARSKNPKFEVRVREGMSVHFVRKDGSTTGSIIRPQNDNARTLLVLPNDEETTAVIFPIRGAEQCSYETVQSAGEYLACKRIGSVRVGNEDWGIGYASYDSN
jgi:hypothetical protein